MQAAQGSFGAPPRRHGSDVRRFCKGSGFQGFVVLGFGVLGFGGLGVVGFRAYVPNQVSKNPFTTNS